MIYFCKHSDGFFHWCTYWIKITTSFGMIQENVTQLMALCKVTYIVSQTALVLLCCFLEKSEELISDNMEYKNNNPSILAS